MIVAGLIGYPVGHSRSEEVFEKIFQQEGLKNASYKCFPLKDLSGLDRIIWQHPSLLGLNVTIPYKTRIIPLLHELHPEAETIGAVNTLHIQRKATGLYLTGYNSDIYGFESMMEQYLGQKPRGALILGSGGVSKTVKTALQKRNIPNVIISRTGDKNRLTYQNVSPELLKSHPLLVNCTPAGMAPYENTMPPLPVEYLNPGNIIFDLVYNPEQTLLMKEAIQRGAKAFNGSLMLKKQAERSWEFWKKH